VGRVAVTVDAELVFISMALQTFRAQASCSVPYSFFIDGRTPWTSDQPVTRPLLNTGQHKHRMNTYTYQTSMPCVVFEPTIPASKRAKTVLALDRAATVTATKP
jgi:hypothetical protein